MRKKLIRGYILIAFVLIIYITAVTPFPKTAVFGIALGFSLPSFLAQIYTLHAVMKNQALIKDRLYDFPVIRVSVLYLAAQLCASLLLMGFADKLPVFAAVIIEMVILAAAVMGLYAIGSARTEAVRQDVQLKREMTKMKEMQAQVNLLISQCREGQVRDMLGKLSEEIRYSSPLSGEASEEIEEEIAVLLTEIEAAALDEDVENVAQLYDRMTGLLRERDRICKDSKWQQF